MTVVDRRTATTEPSRHPLNQGTTVEHVDPVDADHNNLLLADQPARNRVRLLADRNRATGARRLALQRIG